MTRRFVVHRHAPVRADAESMFVAASEVPDAQVGDLVELASADGSDARLGVVVEHTSRSGEPFVRVELRATEPDR